MWIGDESVGPESFVGVENKQLRSEEQTIWNE